MTRTQDDDRPKRRDIPRRVKAVVVERQGGRCKCGCNQIVSEMPRTNTHFDHEPALILREVDAMGLDYIPAQHDPKYIDARCPRSHKIKTSGSGATTAGTDIGKMKKENRRARAIAERDKPKPNRWSSRGFPPKGSRKMGSRPWQKRR